MLHTCTCTNEYQDKLYGKGVRVHNPMKAGTSKFRCTVCKKEVLISPKKEDKPKK